MNDLEWLARHVHQWPIGADYIAKHEDKDCWHAETESNANYEQHNDVYGRRYNRDHWQAERARLQNKPRWEDAPEWAKWLCQTSKGDWFFCKSKQTPNADKGWDDVDDNDAIQCMDRGEVLGDWRDTLERRPERSLTTNESECLDSALRNSTGLINKGYLVKEWKQGELPPVGTECEIHVRGAYEKDEWRKILVEALTEHWVIFGEWAHPLCKSLFRPLRTEEDRAVEDMYRDATGDDLCGDEMDDQDVVSLCQILYKAGYRKQEPSE